MVCYRRKHMFRKKKPHLARRSKGLLSPALKEDRISQLPNHLISHILSLLSTKEAVKTSVLSTRWRHLWFSLPNLELKSREFADLNTFMSVGERFFGSNTVSCIDKLKLTIDQNEDGEDDVYDHLTSWFDAAAKRTIRHLHVNSYSYADRQFLKMPQRLYSCETLVCLKLFQVTLDDAEFVCLPCLKTMHLEYVEFPNEATFETLVLCCSGLECLKIVVASEDGKVFRVHSRSLKKLTFERLSSYLFESAGVVIDAPRLCFLSINDNVSKSFTIENFESLEMSLLGLVRLHEFDDEFDNHYYETAVSSRRSIIRSFVNGISILKTMLISRGTFKLISQYSKLEPMPKFGDMSDLRITLNITDFKCLPTSLESFPNLKNLILVCLDKSENMDQVSFPYVPQCLLSSLESVDFIVPINHYGELKLVKYFLKNSAILKKLTLSVASYANKDTTFKKLLKFPRKSAKCKVIIL